MTKQNRKRAEQIAKYRSRGWTYQRIATKYGLSRQRVHAILKAGGWVS